MAAGRPETYNPKRHPRMVLSLARKGKTVEEICDAIGIVKNTLYQWAKKHPEISDALKEGREDADSQIETALFQRAKGYSYQEKRVIQYPDGTTRKEVVEKFIPPDVTAGIFWLKNRRRDDWRDVKDLEHTGKDGSDLFAGLSNKDIVERTRQLLQQEGDQ